MKNKNNRIKAFYFFLIILYFFIYGSCSKKDSQAYNEEPVIFTYYSPDFTGEIEFSDAVAQEITKRTGVKLKPVYINREKEDVASLMLADDFYPDLIFAKGNLSEFVEKKALVPFDQFIDEHGNNMKKLYGNQLSRLRYSMDDPSIYATSAYEIRQEVNTPSGSLQIQNAVLKDAGYPKIQTLDDFEKVLLAYKRKYPEINGHKTIGLSFVCDEWWWFVDLSNPAGFVWGFGDDGQWIVDQKTYKATYKFLYPKIDVYFRWLNKLYNEDLLDPDSFTQTFDVWKTKISEGYILGTSCPYYQLSELQNKISLSDHPERSYAFLPVTAQKGILEPSLKDYGFAGGWGIAITKSCKDPERAFEFLDWLCSEEAQILTNWGIEGQDYYYDNSGKRISLNDPVKDRERGIGAWAYPFPQAGTAYKDSTGNFFGKSQRDNVIKSYNEAEKETLQAYGAETWNDLFPASEELGVSDYGQVWQYPLKTQSQKIVDNADAYVKQALISMIMDKPEKFDSSWNTMCAELKKMGIEDIGKEITDLIVEKVNFWKE